MGSRNYTVRAAQAAAVSETFSAFRVSRIAAALAVGLAAWGAAQAAPPVEWAKGRVIVQVRPGLSDAELEKVLKPHGGAAKRLGQSTLFVITLPPTQSEVAVAALLAHNPHFKFAELDYRVAPNMAANDPYAGSAWHLSKIGAPTAWDVSVGSGVTVAVLDSGVDPTHPDLSTRLVPGWNFYDNNSNTSDVYGHGTQVAGGVAATINNSIGVASVAGQASIMPIRVTDTSGAGYTSMIANGLTYAADRGVRVANISFANQPSRSAVVSAAQYMKDKGGLVFVAAGNSGISEPFTPTTSMIPVSATDGNDVKASWSSYGSYVALSAPGVGIYTTTRGGGYTAASGTSIATPVAAGVAALTMAARPSLKNTEVESILFSSATDLGTAGRDTYYGHGRVDAGRSVSAALSFVSTADTQAPTVAIAAPLGSATVSGTTTVDVTAADNVGVSRVDLLVNGAKFATDTSAPFGFSWNTTGVANGMASLVAVAYDAAGNSTSSTTVSINVANNVVADTTPPVVSINNPVNGSKVSGNVSISISASDNGGSAGISQKLLINGVQVASSTGGSLSYNWNTRKIAAGTYSISAVVCDAAGNSTTKAISVSR
ncbi:MAG: S8 family serine peptidase [Rubrivivax sp.]|nr:S8 family serine peptidase [Rubrivivax sp.]